MIKNIFNRFWRVVRWPLGVIAVLFGLLVLVRIPFVYQKQVTEEAVAKIHSTKLQMADVTGERLPPEPDAILKDATIAGVDANYNGIRDDVELAIFAKYPASARIRSAELQYALGLQMQLTQVFNSETLVAVLQEKSRGRSCVVQTGPKLNLSSSQSEINAAFAIKDGRWKEVDNLMLNTQARKDKEQQVFEYMTTYGDIGGEDCDIDSALLLN